MTKQLRYYRVLLERNGYAVRGAVVIYIDVNKAYAEAYPVNVLDAPLSELEAEMLERRNILRKALNTNEPPPREMGWWCNTCECASLCFGSAWYRLRGDRK